MLQFIIGVSNGCFRLTILPSRPTAVLPLHFPPAFTIKLPFVLSWKDDDPDALHLAYLGRYGTCSCQLDNLPGLTLEQISIYYIMSFTYEEYGKATSISNIAEQWTGPKSNPLHKTPVPDEYCKPDSSKHLQDRRANASIVVLVRNSELREIMSSISHDARPKTKRRCMVNQMMLSIIYWSQTSTGFTIAISEIPATIPTLWNVVKCKRIRHLL